MNTKTTVLTLMLAAASFSAQAAGFVTGNDLLAFINSPDDGVRKTMAVGYVSGVSDATRGAQHCAPAGVEAGQMMDMTKKVLEGYPELRHGRAASFVIVALKNAWPCPEKKPTRSGSAPLISYTAAVLDTSGPSHTQELPCTSPMTAHRGFRPSSSSSTSTSS